MPKLWESTIAAHRHSVRDAILDTTAALVSRQGLPAVTMSQIAAEAGVGRATLYKYFSDVEAILVAWHDRHVAAHLQHLRDVGARTDDAGERLEAVLDAYALISYERAREHTGPDVSALVHRDQHVVRAMRQLSDLVRDLIIDAARTGAVRDDIAADELARYCLNALAAASGMRSKSAVQRLVAVTLAGLRPPAKESK